MENIEHDSFDEPFDFLTEIKKDNAGFKVPKDYFANMQSNVLDQLIEPEAQPVESVLDTWIKSLKIFLQPQYALIGVMGIVLVAMTIGLNNNSEPIKPDDVFGSLNVADFEYYFDSNVDNFNNQEIIAVLSEDEQINQYQIAPISTVDLPEAIADEYIDDIDNAILMDLDSEDN